MSAATAAAHDREETGEKLKIGKNSASLLSLMRDNKKGKFHGIWRSSGWEVFKAASPFAAIWCH